MQSQDVTALWGLSSPQKLQLHPPFPRPAFLNAPLTTPVDGSRQAPVSGCLLSSPSGDRTCLSPERRAFEMPEDLGRAGSQEPHAVWLQSIQAQYWTLFMPGKESSTLYSRCYCDRLQSPPHPTAHWSPLPSLVPSGVCTPLCTTLTVRCKLL